MPKRGDKPVIENINNYKSVLIGLMGHVDAGKTAVAKMISQIVSTAGLDAHPQSQERGITIDLGFTSLILDNYLITLVDAPGHADLIRSVVASANIIQGAIIVIDGVEGMQIQTAEHLVILESMGITNIIVVINKIDLMENTQIESLRKKIRNTLKSSKFNQDYEIVEVSAINNIGGELLKDQIKKLIQKIELEQTNQNKTRSKVEQSFLIYPIDHHFKIKGIGTIVTGTILQGSIKTGDSLIILPQNKAVKIKSLQVFHQNVAEVKKGYRVGASIITELEEDQMARGNIITSPEHQFIVGEIISISLTFNKYFKRIIHYGSQINITYGLNTINARIFPYQIEDNNRILIEECSNESNALCKAYLWLFEPVYMRVGDQILLSQLDLPPNTLRFFGKGIIEEILPKDVIPELQYIKVKQGKIKKARYGQGTILIEGLAQSREGADTLIGKSLDVPNGIITATFGNKGVVVAKVEESQDNLVDGADVILKIIRSNKIK